MNNPIEIAVFLCGAALAIACVAVFGHGLWVIAAAVLKAIAGIRRPDTRSLRAPCPQCGSRDEFSRGMCDHCGFTVTPADGESLTTTVETLERLFQLGRISPEQYSAVVWIVESERVRLEGPGQIDAPSSPAAAFAPAPVPAGPADIPGRNAAESATAEAAEVLDAELVEDAITPADMAGRSAAADAAVHPLDRVDGSEPMPRPSVVRPALADMLQAFLEEKNIRWGELASGILVVGSAIGLIVSLRATLQQLSEQVPYIPALLFMLGTAAINGAGWYTLRRWKLRSTSRGVLVIGTLLVPLSFAAGIVLSGSGPTQIPVMSFWYLTAVVVGILGYGVVTTYSARALFPTSAWPLTVSVMVPSIGQLIINRQATARPDLPGVVIMLGLTLVPVAGFLAATLAQLRIVSRKPRITPVRATQTYVVLGVAAFALIVPLTLLLWLRGDLRTVAAQLAPILTPVTAVVVATGLAIRNRCKARAMATTSTVGTALAIFGVLLMAGTVILAWPHPDILLAVSIVAGVALASVGVVGNLPLLLAGSVVLLSLAVTVGWHIATGTLTLDEVVTGRQFVDALLMGRTAAVLLVPTLAAGLVGLWCVRRRLFQQAQFVLAGSGFVLLISAAVAYYAGFYTGIDADLVTPLFLLYAIATLLGATQFNGTAAGFVGSAFMLTCLIHALGWNHTVAGYLNRVPRIAHHPLLLAVVIHAVWVQVLAAVIQLVRRRSPAAAAEHTTVSTQVHQLVDALVLSGIVTSALAIPNVLWVRQPELLDHTIWAAALAIAWMLAAVIRQHAPLMMASQIAAAVALAFGVATVSSYRFWPENPLRRIWHWQLQLAVLGLWCALLAMLRMSFETMASNSRAARKMVADAAHSRPSPWEIGDRVLRPIGLSLDNLLLVLLVPGLVIVSAIGCWPGVMAELGVWQIREAMQVSQWTATALQGGGWIALACIVLALIVGLGERVQAVSLIGLSVATAAIPLLLAGRYEGHLAVASALRWGGASFVLIWAGLIAGRQPLRRVISSVWPLRGTGLGPHTPSWYATLTVLGLVPIVGITGAAFAQAATGVALAGPNASCWFGRLPASVLYGGPMVIAIVAMVTMAIRDRQSGCMMLGALLLQGTIGIAVAFPVVDAGRNWSPLDSVHLLQWSAIGWVGFGVIWQLLARRITDTSVRHAELYPLTQVAVGTLAVMALAVWAAAEIVAQRFSLSTTAAELGRWPSLVAVVGWIVVAMIVGIRRLPRLVPHVVPVGAWLIATVSAAVIQLPSTVTWPNYRQLVGGWIVLSIIMAAVTPLLRKTASVTALTVGLRRWATGIGLAALALITSFYFSDPLNPWWTTATSGLVLLLLITCGWQARNQWYGYLTLPVSMMCVVIIWHDFRRPVFQPLDCVFLSVLAASLVAAVWMGFEIASQRREQRSFDFRSRLPRVHLVWASFASFVMPLSVCGIAILSTALEPNGMDENIVATPAALGALVTLTALLVGASWDRRARFNMAGLYIAGLVLIAMAIHLGQVARWLDRSTSFAVASCALAVWISLTGHAWKWGLNIVRWAERLWMPAPINELKRTRFWLPIVNLAAVAVIGVVAFSVVTGSSARSARTIAAFAPFLAAYGVSCLAQKQRGHVMLCMTLLLVSITAVFLGWSTGALRTDRITALRYTIQLIIVMVAATVAYGAGLVRWVAPANPWHRAARTTSVITAALAGAAMVVALTMEAVLFRPGVGVPIETSLVIAVSAMLGLLAAACLSVALLPSRDPLGLSPKGRELYVYATQVIAGLLFAHLYLTKPYLFQSFLRPYWPYLVVVLAFFGVGIGEICRRFQWTVLAEPLQRTGGFLPLIPALGIWVFASNGSHALVLFVIGLLYVTLAVVRRSYIAGFAAALAGNGALWTLLYDSGFSVLNQPQFWLIPPAVSVLVAAQINRERLNEAQLTAIRYICMIVIYISSSGEMFMRFLGPAASGSWSRPVILACLSVAGMFAGILLRIRAFLYLGASFLLLSVMAMVWNAARLLQHTWPWWAFGITLGLSILVLFGAFEKHRREAQQLVHRLRQWEP